MFNKRPLPPFPTHKSRELFAYLVVHANRNHSRSMLAGLLWPEKTEEKARASLSTEIWRLRRVLESFEEHLLLARDEVGFKIEPGQVDVQLFGELIQKQEYDSLTRAVELYTGDFLEGCYSDWCLLMREQFRDSLTTALEKLLDYHKSRGNWAEAIVYAKSLIGYDPLREELHRTLIHLFVDGGQRASALAQYQFCADLLLRELGVQPMPETQALFRQLQAGSPAENLWLERVSASHELTRQKLNEMKRINRYVPDVFSGRHELDALAGEFSRSQHTGFILIGPSGYGKTNWLAHLAEERMGTGDLVLYYDARFLTLTFERDLARQVCGSDSSLSVFEAVLAMGREAHKNGKVVWILVDDLNAFRDLGAAPADLLRRLEQIASSQEIQYAVQADQCRLKVVITCRDHTWRQIIEDGLDALNWGNYFTNQPIQISGFDAAEMAQAFQQYAKYFNVEFPALDIQAGVRSFFSHPLLLRLMAEIWQGRSIPEFHSELFVFRQYLSKALPNVSTRMMADRLVTMMLERGRSSIYLSDFPGMDIRNSPLGQLLESGVLIAIERGLDQVLSFAHARLFEYLIAEHLLLQFEKLNNDPMFLIDHARRVEEFPPLRGALIMALAIHGRAELFSTFAVSDAPGIRDLCMDGLVALHGENPQSAVSLAKQILALDSLDAKRAALRAVPFMDEEGYEVFYAAVDSPSETVRRLALISLDQLWRRDRQLAVRIMRRLIDEVKPQTALTAPRKIQTLLRIIGWFSNYGMPQPVLDELDDLAHRLAVEKLKLPSSESAGILWPLVKRILAWNTVSWPSDEDAIHEIVRPDGLDERERIAFRSVLSTLRQGEAGLGGVLIGDIKILLQSRIDPARYPAHHQLALWLHFHPQEALSAIESIYDDLDGHARLWVIMAFLPLSARPASAFPHNGLDLLEEFTARLAEENEPFFLEGVERGALRLLGEISFLPLGLRYIHAGKNKLPMLASLLAASKAQPEKYAWILRLLAPLGWFHPREVFDFLSNAVDVSQTRDSRLLEMLGSMHVFHPNLVDAFLQKQNVDEALRQRIRVYANIEQITHRARILSTQDVRVTSILLNSPYGQWLTDCVMSGYLEAKTPKEAARRFGDGLFETLRECDWSLKRLFGTLE